MREQIRIAVLDWAGTVVDYGCFAPMRAFISAFESLGVSPTVDETRAPMGLPKRAHIAKMLTSERLSSEWVRRHGRSPSAEDVDEIYAKFEPALFAVLNRPIDVLPEALTAVADIRRMGVKIGSTTGYTKAMMDVVAPAAASAGYKPDSLVCPDDVGGVGRPLPYMLWRNLEILGAESIHQVIKVGDTVADITEGKSAGCLSVGVVRGSSLLGLSLVEYERKTVAERAALHEATRKKYLDAGADFVLDGIAGLAALIKNINEERK